MWLLAPNYGDAQAATSAEEFRGTFSAGERTRYTAAAVLDLGFAAVYAALAVSLGVRANGRTRALGVLARAGSGLVVAAAVFDQVENVRLLRNIADYATVSDEAVRSVARLAPVKWGLGVGGALVVLTCVAVARRSSDENEGRGVKLKTAASYVPDRARAISQRWRWAAIAASVLTAVGAVAFVVFVRPKLGDALLAGVVLQLSVWLLRNVWAAELTSRGDHPLRPIYERAQRMAAIVVPSAAFLLFIALWFSRDKRGVAVYIGGVGLFVGIGIALQRWRADRRRDRRWGPRIVVAATLLALVSLLVATVNVSWTPLAGVLAGVFVFPIGLALIAADHADDGGPVRLAWGTAATAAGMAGLALAGIEPYQLLMLTVGLVVLVGLIASNTSHDIVLVLLAIALIWSLEPQRGDKQPDPQAGKPTIVALGDSYMSGEGARKYFLGTNHNYGEQERNECRRAPSAYPVRARDILADRGRDYEVLFLACSGAKSHQLLKDAQYSGEPTSPWSSRHGERGPEGQAQLPQAIEAIQALDLKPEIVLISIGGNDAGFGEIGQTCGLAGDCSALGQRWFDGLETTRTRLRATYQQLAFTEELKGARFLVIPYPVPLNESGCGESLLRPNEHRLVVGFARALDRVLEEEARAAGFDFLRRGVDVFTRERVRICDVQPSKAAVNQLAASPVAGVFLQRVSPRAWFHNAFHPNQDGHNLIALEVANWIAPPDEPLRQPAPSEAPMKLEGVMGAGFDHCASGDRVPATCLTDRSEWSVVAMTRLLWALLVPVALLVVGALLLAMEAMRRWPGRGTVWLARRRTTSSHS